VSAIEVSALYVCSPPRGVYFGLNGVDPWDEGRDARNYPGPHSVVAHPPCARWGKYWHGGPNSEKFPRARQVKGDDGGCFAAALAAVRQWGGVIEHPAGSAAWEFFQLLKPPHTGGWVSADWQGGWTCHVEQGHYGHRARKATWLYACNVSSLPSLRWGPSQATAFIDDGYHSAEERMAARSSVERLSKHERLSTPLPFRDLLLGIARTAGAQERAA